MLPAQVTLFTGPTTWLIVIVILVVVFGASRLPDIARNVGKSAKVLKDELNDLSDDTKTVESKEAKESGAGKGEASGTGESK